MSNIMIKKSINIKNTNKVMMILDTNVCRWLFPKGHKILGDIEPGSSKNIKFEILKEMKTKKIFITNMIKRELSHKLFRNEDQIILKNIIYDYKIQILNDDTKYLNEIDKLCKKAYDDTKHMTPTTRKIQNNISKMNGEIKKTKEKLELLTQEWKKPNEVLDDKIEKTEQRYDTLVKLMEQMKKYPEYALVEYNDRVILSTALSATKNNNVVEIYTGDGGLLAIQQVMKKRSILIRYPSIVRVRK